MKQTIESPMVDNKMVSGTLMEKAPEMHSIHLAKDSDPGAKSHTKKVKLCIVEEQEILLQGYATILPAQPTIELIGISGNSSTDNVISMISTLQPEAVILGTTVVQPSTIEKMEAVREHFPGLGIVLLATIFDDQAMKRLKHFTKKNPRGCAFLLKHSIDKVNQLIQAVRAVVEGQIILDSLVMESLIEVKDIKFSMLKDLTHRELEVVSWMAKGFRNETIADILCVDRKTVERHINCIYSKLEHVLPDSKQPRVSIAILYLKATGLLPDYDLNED